MLHHRHWKIIPVLLAAALSLTDFAAADSYAFGGEPQPDPMAADIVSDSSSFWRIRSIGRNDDDDDDDGDPSETDEDICEILYSGSRDGVVSIEELTDSALDTLYDSSLWYADDLSESKEDRVKEELPGPTQQSAEQIILNNRSDNRWVSSWTGDGKSVFSLDETVVFHDSPYSLKIKNSTYTMASVKQTFAVKPHTDYIFTAYARYEDYVPDPASGAQGSGASIGTDFSWSHSAYVTGSDWEQLCYSFRTGEETEYTLALSNGMYDAGCRGTAWFTGLKLEEADAYSSQWNILAVVFKNLDAAGERDGEHFTYERSFDGADVNYIAEHVKLLKTLLPEISDGRMQVSDVDVFSTEAPVTSLIPYDYDDDWGSHVRGWQPAMTWDNVYREISRVMDRADKVYNQIIIIMPGYDIMGWAGLSNADFRGANVCKILDSSGDRRPGRNDVSECSLVDVHEMCHNLEDDTEAAGIRPVSLHSRSDHGYSPGRDGDYAWYSDYMRNTIRDGSRGIDPSVYRVPNSYEVIFEDMKPAVSLTDEVLCTVTWEGADLSAQQVERGTGVEVPDTPSRSGYRFAGWYTDAEFRDPCDLYQPVMQDMTVHARWVQIMPGDEYLSIDDGKLTAYTGPGGEITIPADVQRIDTAAFADAEGITGIRVAQDNDSFTSLDGVLFTGDEKTLVAYPNCGKDSYTVPEGTEAIGDRAFEYNTSLTRLTLPEGLKTIGTYSLLFCSGLTSLNIPESVTTIGFQAMGGGRFWKNHLILSDALQSVGAYAFQGATFRTAVIGSGVTKLENHTFQGCARLHTVSIPESVTAIDTDCFNGCRALTDIWYAGTEEDWEAVSREEAKIPEGCTVHFGEMYIPEPDTVWTIGPGGDHPSLADAMQTITEAVRDKTAGNSYTLEIGDGITEKRALKLPKANLTVTISGGELMLGAPVITANCDLVLDCTIACSSGKKPALRIAAGRTVCVDREQKNFGAVKGTRTSGLVLNEDMEVQSIRTLASVDTTDRCLTVSGSASGVGMLNGTLRVGTDATIADIGTATVSVNGKNAAQVSIRAIDGKLTIDCEDDDQITGGLTLFRFTGREWDGERVEVLDGRDGESSAEVYLSGRLVKAETQPALTLYAGGTELGRYASFEEAFARMTDSDEDYTITVSADVQADRLVLPKKAKSITIAGEGEVRTIDCGKTGILRTNVSLTLKRLRPVSGGRPVKLISGKAPVIGLEDVELAAVNTGNMLCVGGDVRVRGPVSAGGICSDTGATLALQKLTIQDEGIREDSEPVTLSIRDRSGEVVPFSPGDRISAITKFGGNFSDALLLLSEENCAGAGLRRKGNRVSVAR